MCLLNIISYLFPLQKQAIDFKRQDIYKSAKLSTKEQEGSRLNKQLVSKAQKEKENPRS